MERQFLRDSRQGQSTYLREIWQSDISKAAQKYLFVGGVSALIEWAIFAFLLFSMDQHYLVSGASSFIFANAANYFLSVRYVFGTGRRPRSQRIVLLYLVSAIGIVFNLGVLALGVDVFGMHAMAAKFLATGAVFGWNFAARYFFVFQK